MSAMLTTASVVKCPHGGTAQLVTKNMTTKAHGRVLLETDKHHVIGCGFWRGNTYSPCFEISWSAGVSKVSIRGTKVLVKTSVGTCRAADKVVQGIALVSSTQHAASAR